MTWTVCNDDMPWTEGDAQTAAQHGEPFGATEILFSVVDDDGDLVCLCPWRPGDLLADQKVLRERAKIVSVAPDMLALLQRIWNENEIRDRRTLVALVTLIEKATGE